MDNELILKSGMTLHLRPVNWMALWGILRKFGKDALSDPDKLLKVEGDQALDMVEATDQLFNFCAGWGVSDDPPVEALAELEEMGFVKPGQPHLARANWLRFLVMEDDEEFSELIAAVMALAAKQAEAEGKVVKDGGIG